MDRAQLLLTAERMRTLEDVVRWRAVAVAEVVVQDEYTHDVVVTTPLTCFLVFDTT